ncbi:MAG: DNA polymerase/3'-5' exonuclease PolX [Candidatus Pacebacteria bacterium]|nr:DNA polymerase/3'-5' exonuclease PolX [Candidatus Paceibacterota bacterium]
MENNDIADIFDDIADLLDIQDANAFRIRSYRSAAQTVRGLSERLEDIGKDKKKLRDIPNIGKSTSDKIVEILTTGTCTRLEELREEIPEDLTTLMEIPQLGPRKVAELYRELNIKSLDELRKACEDHKVRDLEGMGEKTEENILHGIATLEQTAGRTLLKAAAEQVEALGRHLDRIDTVEKWQVAGSFRRGQETVGDLDILVHATDREKATSRIVEHRSIKEVASRGSERVTVHLTSGLQVDFRYFAPKSFGSALMYFTGSKAHNIKLRKRAQSHNWKLNEYGLLEDDTRLAGETEEGIFEKLGLPWIPPELREDRGEIDAAEKGDLPTLVSRDDLRGDLHCHSTASDGNKTVEEMARAAVDLGYDYIAITDHSKAVTVANGLDEKRLRDHAAHIHQVDDSMDTITVLAGIEVDILEDGTLDLAEDALKELDWVTASVHSHFSMPQKDMTERILKAVRSGLIHSLGHPMGRMLGRREPIQFDTEEVFNACRENHVALEINSQPERLDLPDNYCKMAKDMGVTFTVCTDAHNDTNLQLIHYGILVARRGWLTKDDIVNTWTLKDIRDWVKNKE